LVDNERQAKCESLIGHHDYDSRFEKNKKEKARKEESKSKYRQPGLRTRPRVCEQAVDYALI